MLFSPDLAAKVMAGEKTVTRRPVKEKSPDASAYKVGRLYTVQPGRGKNGIGHIRILSITKEPIDGVMRYGEAQKEGFETFGDFVERWRQLYGHYYVTQLVWRIRFEVAK